MPPLAGAAAGGLGGAMAGTPRTVGGPAGRGGGAAIPGRGMGRGVAGPGVGMGMGGMPGGAGGGVNAGGAAGAAVEASGTETGCLQRGQRPSLARELVADSHGLPATAEERDRHEGLS